LRGRLVVALRSLERYCAARGIEHPALTEFIEY
jgi:hypothetical protein